MPLDPMTLLEGLDKETLERILSNPQEWAETFLTTPTTRESYKSNFVQKTILSSKSRFNVIRVHRRGGKSFSLAILALYYALTLESCEVLVVAPAGNHVEKIFQTIRDFIRASEWIDTLVTVNKRSPHRIMFSNGSSINGFTTGTRTKGEGVGIRGQGGDVVLIDEADYLAGADWQALKPIMQGDKHRRQKPRVFASSTPRLQRGIFYDLCKNPEKSKGWNKIHIPVTENPDWAPEDIENARNLCSTELEWALEWLADFPDFGLGVFPQGLVSDSLRDYTYQQHYSLLDNEASLAAPPSTRTIGVDWDKFNKDGHGCNIVVLESMGGLINRLVYREEIPQSKFTLTNAVERLIELNTLFRPEWIYIDRGYGDYQLEELQRYTEKHPENDISDKVVGIQFAQTIECPLPNGGIMKRKFKTAMVWVMRGWFEKRLIELPEGDIELQQQLLSYSTEGENENNIKFSKKNDHLISALGLAVMAMHQKVKDPYASKPANKSYVVPVPQAVPSEKAQDKLPSRKYNELRVLFDTGGNERSFSRRYLGNSGPPPPRRTF